MENNYLLLMSTCPTMEVAQLLAQRLLEKHLVACVNIIPNIQSIYEWQGKIENSQEFLMVIKTQSKHYAEIEQTVIQHHPYQVPELIAFPIMTGLPSYLAWISEVTHSK